MKLTSDYLKLNEMYICIKNFPMLRLHKNNLF